MSGAHGRHPEPGAASADRRDPGAEDAADAPAGAERETWAIRLRGGRAQVVLAVVGAMAAAILASRAPAAPGAARVAAPETLLGAFDVLWLVALAWPRALRARDRTSAALRTLAVGLPFHVALAAAAGAGSGHAAAALSMAGAAALAGVLGGRARTYAPLLALGLIALPLAGYGLADLAGSDALGLVRASPLLAAALLARDAPSAGAAAGAVPAAVLLGGAAIALLAERGRSRSVAAVLLVLGVASSARAATPRVEVVLGGCVRDGRPLVVRAAGALRVRAGGGPWAGPVGVRGDEFVVLGARPRGDVVTLEVEGGDGGGAVETGRADVDVRVHVLAAAGPWTARLDGAPAGAGECAVRPLDLPTVPEAWLVFDHVRGVPDGLRPEERAALEASLEMRGDPTPHPLTLPPSPELHRAAAESASTAPRLPADVARVLAVVAALTVALVLLAARRGATTGRPLLARPHLWLAAAPLCALAWLLAGASLPGAVHASALVLAGPDSRLVVLRLHALRQGTVSVTVPPAASVLAPVRWASDDEPPDGTAVGRRARITLAAGRTVLLAYRLPGGVPADGAALPGRSPAAQALSAWLRGSGDRAADLPGGADAGDLRLDGARLVGVEGLAVVGGE